MPQLTLRPHSARYDEELMEIVFCGEFGDTPIRCAVTREAVADHLADVDPAAMQAICERRLRVFEAMFVQRHRRHQIDPDGTIRIRSGDLHGTGIGPAAVSRK
jgi:hypothetical protein